MRLDFAGVPMPTVVEARSLTPLAFAQDISWRDFVHAEQAAGSLGPWPYFTDRQEDGFVENGQLVAGRRTPVAREFIINATC